MAGRMFAPEPFPTRERPVVSGDHPFPGITGLDGVIEQLGHYRSGDPRQLAVRESMIEFARAHPDALLRTCAPGHFTASALVVERGTGRFVLLHHAKLRKWLQPGGHVDGSADMPASALREATEETGLEGLEVVLPVVDLDIHRVEPPREPPHDHLDQRFLVLAPRGSELIGNHESTDIRWATLEDLDDLDADSGLRRLVVNGLEMARRLDDGASDR